jgi:hypothetical protein
MRSNNGSSAENDGMVYILLQHPRPHKHRPLPLRPPVATLAPTVIVAWPPEPDAADAAIVVAWALEFSASPLSILRKKLGQPHIVMDLIVQTTLLIFKRGKKWQNFY